MSYSENSYFIRKSLINDAERKLAEHILSEFIEVGRPSIGRFPNSVHRRADGTFEIRRCNQASFSIPGKRCQIFCFGLWVKPKLAYLPCNSVLALCWTSSQGTVFTFPERISCRRRAISSCQAASVSGSIVGSRLAIRFPANSARLASGRESAFCRSSLASRVML